MRSALALNQDVVAWALTFDLAISIPLFYWFFVVRRRKTSAITVAPVFVACALIASAMMPRGQQQFARDLGRFAVPLAEVALLGGVVHRLRQARGKNKIRSLLGDSRVAEIVESELMMLYYAFFGWRKQPEEVHGRAMTFHERSGWSTILVCIFVLIAAEGVAMHLFLARFSTLAAWGWTMLDLWAVIWLLGDYHALRLHRSVLMPDMLEIRLGMRWSVDVPLAAIASIEEVRNEKEWKRRDVMRLAMLDDPKWLVVLHEPLVAKGMAGFRREIRALALLPDDEGAISALRLALSAQQRRDAPSARP